MSKTATKTTTSTKTVVKSAFSAKELAKLIFDSVGEEIIEKDMEKVIVGYMKTHSLRGSKKAKDPNAPKGKRSAYILYTSSVREGIKKKNPKAKPNEIMSMAAKMWGKLTDKQKKPFQKQADEDKERYETEMKEYKENSDTEGDYASMKVPELKELLKERSLDVKGKKDELIARLEESDAQKVDYSKMKLPELKEMCKEKGLSEKGKKEDLVERLQTSEGEEKSDDTEGDEKEPEDEKKEEDEEDDEKKDEEVEEEEVDYSKMKMDELKALCKEKGLSDKGKKADLVERLQAPAEEEEVEDEQKDEEEVEDVDYAKMKVDQLKALCKERKLSDKGKKAELIERLSEGADVEEDEE